ncbi:MAG: S8/S53 family peptidase [Deltaproteobacteria bacterium]|nr:S8/S53 family peptidase [Deltaproteobacteria bacterium]
MQSAMRIIAVGLVAIFQIQAAPAAQIATLLGRPDSAQSFVREIVKESVSLGGNTSYEQDWTTQLYSILAGRGVRDAISFEVIEAEGGVSNELLLKGFDQAAAKAPVVMTAVGGSSEQNNALCAYLSRHAEAAFVLAAGKSGYEIGEGAEPNCSARNILRVAALGRDRKHLMPSSNFGYTIRIAAAGEEIPVTGVGGRSTRLTGTSPAAAVVAAEIAKFAARSPALDAAGLINRFLRLRTVRVPELDGKIEGARALRD